MTIFYLIRHGETDYSRNDALIFNGVGKDYAPLTLKGRKQVLSAAADSRFSNCNLIISSPYTRALESAAILSRELDLELMVEPTLFEWMADKQSRYFVENEEETRIGEYNRLNGEYPEGEDRGWEDNTMMKNRIMEVMERYLTYDKVIIVCHGMLIHSLFQDRWLDNAEIVEFKYDWEPSERYAIYDSKGKKTGRTNIHGDLRHIGEHSKFVHIVIANHEGEFLLQKRSVKKRFFPWVWDTTGGCIKHYEESLEAALRETYEETGLLFSEDQIQLVSDTFEVNLPDIFFARKKFNIDDCKMDENEVDELKLFSPDEMLEIFRLKPNPNTRYIKVLEHIIEDLL